MAQADLRLSLARCYQRTGALSQALRETALGLKLVEGSGPSEARRATARLLAFRTAILSDQFRPRLALNVGLQAVEEAEASGELDALARAYTKIDEAYQTLGRRDEAVHEEKALEIFEELGDLPGILLLGDQPWRAGLRRRALGRGHRDVCEGSGGEQAERQRCRRRSGRGQSRRSADQPWAVRRGENSSWKRRDGCYVGRK